MSAERGRGDIPEPSKRKGSEGNLADAFGELSQFKKQRPDGDDPTPPEKASHLIWTGPKPRFSYLLVAHEKDQGHNVPRSLNQLEAMYNMKFDPVLRIGDTFEACVVLDCPRFIDNSMVFQVFCEHDTMYNMQLVHESDESGPGPGFEITLWRNLVSDHNLRVGDQILFDKNLDTTISNDFYYILNYVRKQIGGAESSNKPDGGADSSKKAGDGAESSKKLGDGAESSKNQGDDSGKSVPFFEMPVFKVIYHRVLIEKLPRPRSRPFPLEAICLSKILNAFEFSRLFFDVYDAIILADNPTLVEIPLDNFLMEFMVFDEGYRPYNMTLSPFERRGAIFGFCLNGWDDFLRNNDLKQGDRIGFYKFLDSHISNSYYYVVLKLPADVDCLNRRNPVTPGSRQLMPESRCFSKELSWSDVAPGIAGLKLQASEARHFVSSSRSLNEPFMVYDEADRQYDLKLSFFIMSGQVSLYYLDNVGCFLDNVGWGKFVKQNNLKRGDTIDVYKVLDQSVCNDHYFVISIKRYLTRVKKMVL